MVKKYLAILLTCLLLTACTGRAVTIPEGYYSGPEQESSTAQQTPQFFIEQQDMGEVIQYSICRCGADGSLTQIADLGPANDTPFFLWEERIYYTAGGSLFSVDYNGSDTRSLCDSSEEQISFDRITMVQDGWVYCRGTRWQEINNDPAALPGPHRVKAVIRAKADLSEFELLEETKE